MYYEQFESLCNSKGVKPSEVSRATGIATSTFTNWKKGGYTPKQDKLQKIADYFEVSIDFLMNGKEKSIEDTFGEEYAKLVGQIRNDTDLSKALLKYFELSDEKKKHVVELINLFSVEDK